jgi:hypothetical protein
MRWRHSNIWGRIADLQPQPLCGALKNCRNSCPRIKSESRRFVIYENVYQYLLVGTLRNCIAAYQKQ